MVKIYKLNSPSKTFGLVIGQPWTILDSLQGIFLYWCTDATVYFNAKLSTQSEHPPLF